MRAAKQPKGPRGEVRSNHGQFPISLDERNEATKRPGNFLRNSRKSHENQTRHPPNSDIIGKGEKLIDYSKLKSALKNLEVQTANLQGAPGRDGITKLDIEAIQESVIKRFDLAIEMTWKLLMKYLAEEIGIADVPGNNVSCAGAGSFRICSQRPNRASAKSGMARKPCNIGKSLST